VQVRLQKILSGAGVASRRAAEQLMREGRISVNGQTVLDPGVKADPEQDDVRVDGRRIKAQQTRYILLNKPKGYVTTRSDPQRRPTVLALLEGVREYVYPVGRLDYDSEGLLLLTNDGELAARLTHPRHEVARVYEARVRGIPDARAIERLGRGIIIDDRRTAPAEVRLVRELQEGKYDIGVLEMTIREGRNRQVRRMCESVGHPVFALRRIRIGPLTDPKLPTGAWRDLTPREVASLQRVAGSLAAAHEPIESPAPAVHDRPRAGERRRPRPHAGRPESASTSGASHRGGERRASKSPRDSQRPRTRDARGITDARDSRDSRSARGSGLGKQAKNRRGTNAVGKPAHKRKVR
jgi:23S rRNA pseudouridine2605 synthase